MLGTYYCQELGTAADSVSSRRRSRTVRFPARLATRDDRPPGPPYSGRLPPGGRAPGFTESELGTRKPVQA
eukprot:755330-Hanusia_phi.AAC.1